LFATGKYPKKSEGGVGFEGAGKVIEVAADLD